MKISDILENLQTDVSSLNDEGTRDSIYYLTRLEREAQIEDPMLKSRRFFETTVEFYKYTQTKAWLEETSDYHIDIDLVSRYSIPAQVIIQTWKDDLASNCFFLAGYRMLLAVLLNDNPLERAFAAETLLGWSHIFDKQLDDGFHSLLAYAIAIPSLYPELSTDYNGHYFRQLFELELNRILSNFAAEFPQYNMFDANAAQRMIEDEFGGEDPGADLTKAATSRLYRAVTYLLFNPEEDEETEEEYIEDQETEE